MVPVVPLFGTQH